MHIPRSTRIAAAAGALAGAMSAHAGPVTYTVVFDGAPLYSPGGGPPPIGTFGATFTVQLPSPITAAGTYAPTSCTLDAGADALWDCDPVQWFLPVTYTPTLDAIQFGMNFSSFLGWSGFLWFEGGSLGTNGVYQAKSGTTTGFVNDPFPYASFAAATLTVSGIGAAVPAPATAPLALLALAALGWQRRLHRRPDPASPAAR